MLLKCVVVLLGGPLAHLSGSSGNRRGGEQLGQEAGAPCLALVPKMSGIRLLDAAPAGFCCSDCVGAGVLGASSAGPSPVQLTASHGFALLRAPKAQIPAYRHQHATLCPALDNRGRPMISTFSHRQGRRLGEDVREQAACARQGEGVGEAARAAAARARPPQRWA